MKSCQSEGKITCPHPCCQGKKYDGTTGLRRHFFDVHSLSEARSNCVSRKRRWEFDGDEEDDMKPVKEVKRGDEQDTP
jgi:hypothetical protein